MLDVEDPMLPGESLTVELYFDGSITFKSHRIGEYIAADSMENLDEWC